MEYNKYNLCRRCNHARVYRKKGLVCEISKEKPNFECLCDKFSINKTRDNKIVNERISDSLNQNIFIGIGLIVITILLSFFSFFASIFFVLVVIFVYTYFNSKEKDTEIINKIELSNYIYTLAAVHVVKNKNKTNFNDNKIIEQFLISQIGYELTREALNFYKKESLNNTIDLKYLESLIKEKLPPKDAVFLFDKLFSLAIFDNFQAANNSAYRKLSFYFGLSKGQFDFIKSKKIKSEKARRQKQYKYKSNNQQTSTINRFSNLDKYYKIIGVPKTASKDEIKKAYRKLAHKYHPDKNTENEEELTKKFQEILEAYNKLKDYIKK